MKQLNVRTAARAIIIRDNKLLVLRRTGFQGEFYVLPGGGQEHGEALQETLRREVLEEANLTVVVGELLFVNEYIASRTEFARYEPDIHQLDFTFVCSMDPNSEASVGRTPDVHQTGIDWVPLSEIIDYELHPQDDLNFIMGAPTRDVLADWINGKLTHNKPLYIF